MSADAGPDVDGYRPPPTGQSPLEEERDFLLRSLRDLEAEHQAGDIDEVDYVALRDDYTVRAARLLRRLESPDDTADDEPPSPDVVTVPAPPTRARRPWARWQIALAAAIVVIVAGLVGWAVGHNASKRQAGETITGGNISTGGALSSQDVPGLLTQAESEAASDPLAAIKDYNRILTTYPDQPQALTEEGWIFAQAGLFSEAQTRLEQSEQADPSYDPAYGYLGIVLFGQKDYTGAVSQLRFYLSHGPNPALKAQATQALSAAETDVKATSQAKTS